MLASKVFLRILTNPIRAVLKQCNDLLMVGKKTVNIDIYLNEVNVNADVGTNDGNEIGDAGKTTSSKKIGQVDIAR
ncbi:MAG: hypothetical protein H8K07_15000 [Nitrospira sp.]|nr:hypothetical protein [Nitrospira sp.]